MDFDRQLRYFRLQHDRMPEGRFWIPLADLLLRHGQIPEARTLLEEGLRSWPASVSGRWILARCLEAAGEEDGAREAVAAVLAHDPGHTSARALQESLAGRRPEDLPVGAETEAGEPSAHGAEDAAAPEPDPSQAAADPEPAHLSVVPDPEPLVAPEPAAAPVAGVPDLSIPGEPAEDALPEPGPGFRLADDPAPTFVTRTLADIYLEQGHREKALQILRQVLAVHPERDDITARIRAIESGAADATDTPAQDPVQDEDNRRRFDAWLQREAGGGE